MHIFQKIWANKWVLRYILHTIYFNFHYLPFEQAIKLPIWLYKPSFQRLGGKISIESPIKPGMIRMGFMNVGLYANNGIHISNLGHVVFKGSALIGNDCYVGVGENAKLIFGNNFRATTTFRLACFYAIEFGDNVRFGWDCLVADSDFHKMRKLEGGFTKGYGPISIGRNVWIANGCRIMKRTQIPANCVISAGTTICGPVDAPEYSVVGQKSRVEVIYAGRWLDPSDEEIDYDF